MKVSIAGIQYDCTSAIKGADYVLLYDDTTLIASFYGVTNFDSFVLEGGEWSYPYVTLTAAGWQSGDNGYYTQTVTFPGVTDSNGVLIAPRVMRPDDLEAFEGVYIDDSGRGVNSLTFKAHEAKPTVDLNFNVDILKEGATGIFYTGNGGGSGKVQDALDAHVSSKNNPHGVTAEQTKALPLSGGVMTGAINMGGNAISNLPKPKSDGDAARKADVDTATAKMLRTGESTFQKLMTGRFI